MIASVAFRNFKALRSAQLTLAPLNVIIGPNGSGKSSLIQALLRLRTLARLPLKAPSSAAPANQAGAEVTFRFAAPHEKLVAVMSCVHDGQCDALEVSPLGAAEDAADWAGVRTALLGIRAYLFDHYAMALPAPRHDDQVLGSNGGNVAAVLARWRETAPEAFAGVRETVLRLLPEFDELELITRDGGTVEVALRLADEGVLVHAENLSQGSLYIIALAALAHDPAPPPLLCIEEVDRGVHPRLLREVRDLLYRLSYPAAQGVNRQPVQVIVTTHSPYLLDQFRDHPEEIVIAEKHGRAATLQRLSDRPDVLQAIGDGALGDLWYAGVLGGVPDER